MLVGVDASQIEWRVLLELSQDEVGISEIVQKQDTHALNQKAFNLPERVIAKIYLFRTIYRGTGWSFAHDPNFMHVSTDPKFWDAIGEKFYAKYSGIDRCHHRWCDLVLLGQPIIGPLGREWEIPLQKDFRGELKIPWTVFTNYPVQGTSADIMAIARVSFWNRFRRLGLDKRGCKVILTVHDSIVVDCPDECVWEVVNLFYQVFDDLISNIKKLFHYDWTVPLGCECKIGMNLKDMKKVDRTDK
ncbi:MAG: hypothetical protein KGI54_15430 [Pseudomonadota bacterium]|nr:hypothetical protein [Pseudomonadota bacterium]